MRIECRFLDLAMKPIDDGSGQRLNPAETVLLTIGEPQPALPLTVHGHCHRHWGKANVLLMSYMCPTVNRTTMGCPSSDLLQ